MDLKQLWRCAPNACFFILLVMISCGHVSSRARCEIESGVDPTSTSLHCTGESTGNDRFLNFSQILYNPYRKRFVVGAKNVLMQLDENLNIVQKVEVEDFAARARCLEECMNCTSRPTQNVRRLCDNFADGTCPSVLSSRCSSWFSTVADGGNDTNGVPLVVTCSTNYLQPQCEFREFADLTVIRLRLNVSATGDFAKRNAIFRLYDYTRPSLNARNEILQPYFVAGYKYQPFGVLETYPFPTFSNEYGHVMQRLGSSTQNKRDLKQESLTTGGASGNPSITEYVEYIYSFETQNTIHVVAQDYGRPEARAIQLFDEISQPFLISFCKEDNGVDDTRNERVFLTLVRTMLQCRSLLITEKPPSGNNPAVFSFPRIAGATQVTIRGVSFLVGVFNTLGGQPKGAAICAFDLLRLGVFLANTRSHSTVTCPSARGGTGIQCSNFGSLRQTATSFVEIHDFGTTTDTFGQSRVVQGSTNKPLWRADQVELEHLVSWTTPRMMYFYTSYNKRWLATFGLNRLQLNGDSKFVLLDVVPVSLPNETDDSIISIRAVPEQNAVLATTNFQVVKLPFLNCERRYNSCSLCIGEEDGYVDGNCGWCAERQKCTTSSECPLSASWIDPTRHVRNCSTVANTNATVRDAYIRYPPQEVTARVGSTAELTCTAEISDGLKLTWFDKRRGKAVDSSASHITIITAGHTSTLRFSPVQADDGSIYTCIAANNFSTTSRSAALRTIPHFTTHPSSLGLFLGQSQLLNCVAMGYPQPTVAWFKGSTLITNDNDDLLGVLLAADGTLLIRQARLSQAGNYHCQATSDAGVISSVSAAVTVFNHTASDASLVQAMRGESRDLACTSSPAGATFSWYKDNRWIADANSSNYTLANITTADSAVYACTYLPSGSAKPVAAGRFNLLVLGEPEFLKVPVNTTVGIGRTTAMSCSADLRVYPPTVTTWYYSKTLSSPLELLEGPVLVNSGLALTSNQETLQFFVVEAGREGYYHCNISNAQGSLSSFAFLSVSIPPEVTKCQQNVQVSSDLVPVTFTCSVRAKGKVSVAFQREGRKLASVTPAMTEPDVYSASHVLDNPALGTYSCHAVVDDEVQDTSNCSWVLWGRGVTSASLSSSSSGWTQLFVASPIAFFLGSLFTWGMLLTVRYSKRRKSFFLSREQKSRVSTFDLISRKGTRQSMTDGVKKSTSMTGNIVGKIREVERRISLTLFKEEPVPESVALSRYEPGEIVQTARLPQYSRPTCTYDNNPSEYVNDELYADCSDKAVGKPRSGMSNGSTRIVANPLVSNGAPTYPIVRDSLGVGDPLDYVPVNGSAAYAQELHADQYTAPNPPLGPEPEDEYVCAGHFDDGVTPFGGNGLTLRQRDDYDLPGEMNV